VTKQRICEIRDSHNSVDEDSVTGCDV